SSGSSPAASYSRPRRTTSSGCLGAPCTISAPTAPSVPSGSRWPCRPPPTTSARASNAASPTTARGSGARSARRRLAAGIVRPALREKRAEPDVQAGEGGVGLRPHAVECLAEEAARGGCEYDVQDL